MNKSRPDTKDPRELLADAQQAASRKDVDMALCLFDECVREYLKRKLPFKAMAVSKKAKTVLGHIPKVSALIIRSYTTAGLLGDAQQEYEFAATFLKKDSLNFFMALEKDVFIDLLSIMDINTYPRGTIILKRNDDGGDVFVVLTGSCEIYRDSKKLGIMLPGEVFGEIGFFARTARSTTVKTIEKSMLIRMSSKPLHELKERHLSLRQILESIYSERIMKKVVEDLEDNGELKSLPEIITSLNYSKGQEIPVTPEGSVAILKHGIVEVDYDDMCLKTKQYLKPGAIIANKRLRARASTNVVIMLTTIGHQAHTDPKEIKEL
jgi:CRP-like cAMP-binding protein